MAILKHNVTGTCALFTLDPATGVISTEAKKVRLVKGSHNSRRFAFAVPQMIEGHDMTKCDKVEVHYININPTTKEQSADVFKVTDLAPRQDDPDHIGFTWLISRQATKYAGTLSFALRFTCLDGEKILYDLPSEIYTGITVADGLNNSEAVLEDYIDILEAWKAGLSIDDKLQNYAPLVDGKVPAKHLPSYMDDVVEGTFNPSGSEFIPEGEHNEELDEYGAVIPRKGVLYVDIGEDDSGGGMGDEVPLRGKVARWSGTKFVEVPNGEDYKIKIPNPEGASGSFLTVFDGKYVLEMGYLLPDAANLEGKTMRYGEYGWRPYYLPPSAIVKGYFNPTGEYFSAEEFPNEEETFDGFYVKPREDAFYMDMSQPNPENEFAGSICIYRPSGGFVKIALQSYIDGLVGDISAALDEVHAYAQALANGGANG